MRAGRFRTLSALIALTVVGAGVGPAAAAQFAPQPTERPAPILDEITPGDVAVRELRASELATIAAVHGRSVADLREDLRTDDTLFVSPEGRLLYQDEPRPVGSGNLTGGVAQGPYPPSQTFLLHSRPGSNRTLFLDFDGYALPAGTGWNDGNPLTALPYDIDGNSASFGAGELDAIQQIWLQVAEDMAPFDIDVTTEDPGSAAINRASAADGVYGGRLVIGNTDNLAICSSPCGGVSYVGTVDEVGTTHDYFQPSWVFTDLSQDPKFVAEAASHEFGHAMGLSHDGRTSPLEEYYAGHGMWAPIMGVGYYQPVTQWSRGEYAAASNGEDDVTVVQANGIALAADDAGGGTAPSATLDPAATYLIGLTPAADADSFRYVAPCSGTYTFTATPAPVSPNLSIELRLHTFGGGLLASDASQPVRTSGAVATGMGGSITAELTGGTMYALRVLPLANGTASTGWTTYADVGRYTLAASGPCLANNAFAAAAPIGGPEASSTSRNTGFTVQSGEPDPPCGDASTNTAWWQWTAPESGAVTIDTVGSAIDTVLAVYRGSTLRTLVPVACDDDSGGGGGGWSLVTFTATAGTTYRIQVDGRAGVTGSITLRTRGCLGQDNDALRCATPVDLAGAPSTTVLGANDGYGVETGEPDGPCGDALATSSAWWRFDAPGTGSFTIDTEGSAFDTVLNVYTGADVSTLTNVACNDDHDGDLSSSVTFEGSTGTTYWIQVDGWGGAAGSITLRVTDGRPVLRPGAYGTAEGDTGSQVFLVPIVLSQPVAAAVTVHYAVSSSSTTPGIATSGVDYLPVPDGIVTIAAGDTIGYVPITVLGDTVPEVPAVFGEWIPVLFSAPSDGARLDTQTFFGAGLGVIGDDD